MTDLLHRAESLRRSLCRLTLGALCLLASGGSFAQIEEGKAGKYFTFDPQAGVSPDYPKLTLDDLRRLTLYSNLVIKGTQVVLADDKYLRGVEPHFRDKDLLVVTSDHFRFTVLKNGAVDPKEHPAYKFLWIKHASNELLDGKPWLKDLILLPYQKKPGQLLSPWPFKGRKVSKAEEEWEVPITSGRFSIAAADPRPRRLKARVESESVVGTFQSGSSDYLVLDVFGGYSWWGKVAAFEFLPLRGMPQVDIDAFHKAAAGRRTGPPFVENPWRNPRCKYPHTVLVSSMDASKRLQARLPAVLDTKVRTEKPEGWEDLLILDEENLPIKAVDDLLADVKTFGDLVAWASAYLETRWASGSFHSHWFGPLDEDLREDEKSHIVSARVVRYAFRRMGFPAQIHAVHEKTALYPQLFLEVFLPSQKLSWFITNFRTHVICEPSSSALYALPNLTFTSRGKAPVYDIHLGGGKPIAYPARL